jgi:hypothetical protein
MGQLVASAVIECFAEMWRGCGTFRARLPTKCFGGIPTRPSTIVAVTVAPVTPARSHSVPKPPSLIAKE